MFQSPTKKARPQMQDDAPQNMWSSLLDSVASGKRLPSKTILVLGGSTETQKDFLETLETDGGGHSNNNKSQNRGRKKPPVANEFALGYTYQDVLDVDHEDIIARLSIYTLPDPSPAFAPLLSPLFSARAIPETLLVILLDWAEPWHWVRQVRDRIWLLQEVLTSLDDDAKQTMQEVMQDWEQKRRGGSAGDGGGSGAAAFGDQNVTIPLGPGEWDEALGLPLCVVCQNVEKIDVMENEHSWHEEDFDFVLQFLRTILLKHGASLIYTTKSSPNSLPTLVQSMLDIQSLLKRQPLKHNVIDRDKILIPPNWDSWGKIRILREGFDVEGISEGWSLDIQAPKKGSVAEGDAEADGGGGGGDGGDHDHDDGHEAAATSAPARAGGPLALYEETMQDPRADGTDGGRARRQPKLEIEMLGMQDFLASQAPVIERLKLEDEQAAAQATSPGPSSGGLQAPSSNNNNNNNSSSSNHNGVSTSTTTTTTAADDSYFVTDSRVNEHIGPVQFNMGGIQVDAEDMLKRLKERDREPGSETGQMTGAGGLMGDGGGGGDGKNQNEALANFFAGLMKRGGSGSSGPGPGAPRSVAG